MISKVWDWIHHLVTLVSCSQLAIGVYDTRFIETPILTDTCDETTYLDHITSRSSIKCAVECLRDVNCRRMRICKGSTVQCTFYYDGEYCVNQPSDTPGCRCYRKLKACTDGQNCDCPLGYYGDGCENIIEDCTDGYRRNMSYLKYKLATIKPPLEAQPMQVICSFNGLGWTKFMNRENKCGDNNFHRNMTEYVQGFGDSQSMYWLGLEKIHRLLQNHPRNILKVEVYYGTPLNYNIASAYYDNMALGDAATNYLFHVDSLASWSNPTQGDSLLAVPSINNRPFSTFDQDFTSHGCANGLRGGWWYADDAACSAANINGLSTALKWGSIYDSAPVFKIQLSLKLDL